MHKITFTERIDIDTVFELQKILDKKIDLGVLSKSNVQCHPEERDIVADILDNMGIEYTEGETPDEAQ